MRTKRLLIAAAALAAGVISSQAQSNVYSANIVGYYNVPVGGLTAIANSLTAGTPADRLDQVIPYSDGDNVQIWNGVSWDVWTMSSFSASGWQDPSGADVALTGLPTVGAGKGFFYGNNSGITNITFVGQVRTGTNNTTLPTGLTAAGSPLPYSGLVSTGPLNLQPNDGDNIQKWTGVTWAVYTFTSFSATGWQDPSGADGPEPTLNVGQGFFYGNNGTPVTWNQTLNP
jgi:hypothetical protein